MFELGFRHKLIIGLVSACFVLLLVAGLTYSTLAHTTFDSRWVAHTFVVLDRLSDLQSQIADAETGQRGFLLTGDPAYLDPYQISLTKIPTSLLALRELTLDNPVQQSNVGLLETHVRARLVALHEVIEVRKRDGFSAVQTLISDGTGRLRSSAIHADVSNMKAEEDRLLLIRTAALDRTTGRTKLSIIVGEALGFCFLVFAGVVVQQEMNKRLRGEKEIRRLNTDLESRVTELAARSRELERSNTDLQQFAYVASHDLQEPLRTISSFTQLLAKRYREQLDDKAREFIDFAVDGCKRMQALINDLLTFSRVGIESKPLQPIRCDAVLDRALKNLRIAIQESGAQVHRTALPVVMGDDVQLAQLFQNLIANAIKFHGKQPPDIHISAQSQGSSWTITVRDNGIGISPEHRDRVFVIFQRLHNRAQYSGTGIGLAVCKKIVEHHGGSISVQPAPEGGSVFSFALRAAEIKYASSTEKTKDELPIDVPTH